MNYLLLSLILILGLVNANYAAKASSSSWYEMRINSIQFHGNLDFAVVNATQSVPCTGEPIPQLKLINSAKGFYRLVIVAKKKYQICSQLVLGPMELLITRTMISQLAANLGLDLDQGLEVFVGPSRIFMTPSEYRPQPFSTHSFTGYLTEGSNGGISFDYQDNDGTRMSLAIFASLFELRKFMKTKVLVSGYYIKATNARPAELELTGISPSFP